MRPPLFWNASPNDPGWKAYALAPFAHIFAFLTARRVAKPGYKASVPVICVGNLNLGGTGKTPTVIALVEMLSQKGCDVHVVSRGYGGRLNGPVKVVERSHNAADVGDEPLLIAAFATVWVAKDRAAGVRAAEAAGAGIIILDDGFQNPTVCKDISIIVVDVMVGFGNGRVVPSGPLREPVEVGLLRASAMLAIGESAQISCFLDSLEGSAVSVPVMRAHLSPLHTGMDWRGLRVLAFAGIGRPDKFFATLRGLGAEIAQAKALDDHQPLTEALMKRMEVEAFALGAQLVTTEKDAVRLPASFRAKVLTVPVRLVVENWSELDTMVAGLLPQTNRGPQTY